MLVAETRLGHRDDPGVRDRLAGADPARVVLSDDDRRRSRVRTETADGRDLGVVVGEVLRDGDVLETTAGDLVVVELAAVDALVLDLSDLSAADAAVMGHAVGNRHRDLAVRDGEALIPVGESRERTSSLVDASLSSEPSVRYEAVPPGTFDGSAGEAGRGRVGHGHDHDHDGGAANGRTHAHGGDRGLD